MKRMKIEKIIVISTSEKESLEVEFAEGLNIVIGKNKTGKSSIVKSIFYTLGCELIRIEKEWKNIISDYILFFYADEKKFCIYRNGKRFKIFEIISDNLNLIISTDKFHEYSNEIAKIFEVKLPCLDKNGKEFNITPPLLFRFQYIDQDMGWNKVGEQFSNMKYITNWKSYTDKYVVGYYSNEFFDLKNEIEIEKQIKTEMSKKYSANQEFVDKITPLVCKIENETNIEDQLANIINLVDEKTEEVLEYKERIGELLNEEHIINRKIDLLLLNKGELERDIEYAQQLDDEIICPTCGAVHKNELDNQLLLSIDVASADNMLVMLKQDVSEVVETRKRIESEYAIIEEDLRNLRIEMLKMKHLSKYEDVLKNEGKTEFFNTCCEELESLTKRIEEKVTLIVNKEENLKSFGSRDKKKEINNAIIEECKKVASKINISTNFIKLRDFVQVLDKTGSETSRLIFMYYVGLYLYNLERDTSPFNLLVIDTPNQQGQDKENLQGIYDSLDLLLNKEGQVIVATERITGYEDKAARVINLQEERKCLNKENYFKHTNLIKKLLE